jgi:hypothetical protein
MKQEDFEYLAQFESRFVTATKSSYARVLQKKDVERIRDIYSEIIGQTYNMNVGCSSCILKLLQKISPYYFEFKNGQHRKEEESRKADQVEGNPSPDRCGDQEERNPETVGKGKGSKRNRRVS